MPNISKNYLPYDVYERHRKVGSMIHSTDTVLDVGGERDHLAQFCQPKKIIVANLQSGDVIIEKNKLPFANNSFSIVCAIDVLEHIPKINRANFINELLRVCQKKVILSFPIGTPDHIVYEAQIASDLKNRHIDVTFLQEHRKYELPTKESIEKLIVHLKANIIYSGNLTINKMLFKFYLFDPKIKIIRKLIYFFKLMITRLSNPIIYLLLCDRRFNNNVVRVYLVIEKQNNG